MNAARERYPGAFAASRERVTQTNLGTKAKTEMLDITRIKNLAARIEGLPHLPEDEIGDAYDQEGLIGTDPVEETGPVVSFNMACVLSHEKQGCGTVACLAGHAFLQALAEGAEIGEGTIIDEATDYLGLTCEQADALFFPNCICDTRLPVGDFGTIPLTDWTPAHSVRVLREIAAVASMGSEVSPRGIVLAWSEAADIEGLPEGAIE